MSGSEIPYSLEAEQAIIGCFIVESSLYEAHRNKIDVADFFTTDCQRLLGLIDNILSTGNVFRLDTFFPTLSKADQDLVADTMKHARQWQIEIDIATVKRNAACRKRLEEIDSERLSILAGKGDYVTQRKSKLSFRRVSDIMAMVFDDSDKYLGDRMLAAGLNTVLAGPGGIGKSRLLIQMALCSITGRPFLGMPTYAKGKRWLILQSENSTRRMQSDIYSMIKSFSVTNDEIALIEEGLILHTIETDDDVYLSVEDPSEAKEIESAIQDYKATFNVFDPLNTFTTSDLNSDQGMREVCSKISQMVKRGDPTRVPIVLHHAITGKAGAAKAVGWEKSSFGRNSKVLQAWARAQFNLAPRDPDNDTLVLLSCGKCSDGAQFAPMGLKYHSGSGLYTIDPSFNLEEFKQEVGSESVKVNRCPVPKIVQMVSENPQIKQSDLVRMIMEDCGINRPNSYDKIDAAVCAKKIKIHHTLKTVSLA